MEAEVESESALKYLDLLAIYKLPLILAGIGLFLFILGIKLQFFSSNQPKLEFVTQPDLEMNTTSIAVDIAGAVQHPGVYNLPFESRIENVIASAGGLVKEADTTWIAKNLNRAQKITDGTKIYIPFQGEVDLGEVQGVGVTTQNTSNYQININSALEIELDSLPGVGPVTANKIISNRPYQSIDELLSKKVVNSSTFEKIKDQVKVD